MIVKREELTLSDFLAVAARIPEPMPPAEVRPPTLSTVPRMLLPSG